MRVTFKLIFGLWIILLTIVGFLFYSAYSKLEPENFVKILNEQVQKNYPGSKLEIGELDYHFAVDFNLNIKKIRLTRSNQLIGSIGEVEVKVPWWLILFNKGSAQINLLNLDIFIKKEETVETAITETKNKAATIQVSVPDYFTDALFTIRAKNVAIKDLSTNRRYFTLSKFLVREFRYGKNSAFELNLPIEIHHKEKSYTSDLWLFGDITPNIANWHLNYRGEFKTSELTDNFQFENLVVAGKAGFNPSKLDANSSINLLIEKKSVGSGSVLVKSNELVLNLDLTKLPLQYLNLLGAEINNTYLHSKEGVILGNVKFSRDFNNGESSTLEGNLNFDGEFAVSENTTFPGKWQYSFKDGIWETTFASSKRELLFERISSLSFEEGRVNQYTQKIDFTGLDARVALEAAQSIDSLLKAEGRPYYSSSITLNRCYLDSTVVEATVKYGMTPDQKFYQVELNDSVGKLLLNYQKQQVQNKLNLKVTKLNWISSYNFLHPFFNASQGTFDGKVEGMWEEDVLDGKWLIDLKSNDVVEMSGFWSDFNKSIWAKVGVEIEQNSNLKWNLLAQKGIVKLNPFAIDAKIYASLTGTLYKDPKQQSFLTVSYPKNKNMKPVKKEVESDFWKKEKND